MKKFDSKSLLVGVVAGVLLTFTLGADAGSASPAGRFQVAATDSHAIILDTATGRSWTARDVTVVNATKGDFGGPKPR